MVERKIITIDLDGIKSVEEFYLRLAERVELPAHTAINLDALRDVLLGDIAESLAFRWESVTQDVASHPEALKCLKRMLDELPHARADISISYKGCSN